MVTSVRVPRAGSAGTALKQLVRGMVKRSPESTLPALDPAILFNTVLSGAVFFTVFLCSSVLPLKLV